MNAHVSEVDMWVEANRTRIQAKAAELHAAECGKDCGQAPGGAFDFSLLRYERGWYGYAVAVLRDEPQIETLFDRDQS